MKSTQRGSALTAYLVAVLFAVIALAVWQHYSGKVEQEEHLRKAAENTVTTERGMREDADESVKTLRKKLDTQRKIANENKLKLEQALATGPDCRLPGAAGGVLRGLTDEAEAGSTATGAGGATAQADPPAGGGAGAGAATEVAGVGSVSCRAIAIWAQRNIDEVLKPNAAQLEQVQEHYEKLRLRLEASLP